MISECLRQAPCLFDLFDFLQVLAGAVMNTPRHPLKSRWLLSYIPNVTEDHVKAHGGDYDKATRLMWKKVDHIESIEELWSTVNSLPQWTALPPKDQLIFSREATEPFYKDNPQFAKGFRVSVFCENKVPGKSALEAVLIAVIGEGITHATEGASVVDLIRIMRKPNVKTSDAMHIEVWLSDETRKAGVINYLKEAIHKEFPSTKVMESPGQK